VVFDWGVWSAEGEGQGEDAEVRGMGKVELDLCARLYGGKAVREVMGDVLEGVRRILGVDEGEEVVRSGGDGMEEEKRKRKIEEMLGRNKGDKGVREKKRKEREEEEVKSASSLVSASDDDDRDSESEHEEEEGEDQEDQEDVWKGIDSAGLDAFSAFDSRAASASSSSSFSESESDAGPHHHATDEDWFTSSAPKSKSKPIQKLGKGTFLRTLLTGYISNSCSSTSSTTPSTKHQNGPPRKSSRRTAWASKPMAPSGRKGTDRTRLT